MLGTLDASQVEDVLRAGTVGRIGVHQGGRTYVVPVSYAYDGDAVYVHSPEGQKVRMMRASPDVCFEVEEIDDLANWRTVIAWGRFEELEGDIATAAVNLLVARLAPLRSSETAGPAGPAAGTPRAAGIAYRIRLTERTGRFEKG